MARMIARFPAPLPRPVPFIPPQLNTVEPRNGQHFSIENTPMKDRIVADDPLMATHTHPASSQAIPSPSGAVAESARWPLEDGAQGYQGFKEKTDQSLRAVFKP